MPRYKADITGKHVWIPATIVGFLGLLIYLARNDRETLEEVKALSVLKALERGHNPQDFTASNSAK